MSDASTAPPDPLDDLLHRPRRGWLAALLASLVICFAVAPTLPWLQLATGMENLNVATALEMRRDGNWLLPNLSGAPRTHKPPLATWSIAPAITDDVRTRLASHDPDVRAAGFVELAWQVRLVALLACLVLLMSTYEIGRLLDDERLGLVAVVVAGTSLLLLRYGRAASYDVFLATWVAVANAAIAHGLLRGRWWIASLLGSLAIGMAFMTKGPVSLLQTVAPAAVYLALRRGSIPRPPLAPLLVAAVLFSLVAFPWFVYVYLQDPAVLTRWQTEVTREGATDLPPGAVAMYLVIVPLLFPWAVFLVVGMVLAVQQRSLERWKPMLLPLAMLLVPILVMTLFRDRKERYLLPMVVPAAILAAHGLLAHVRSWRAWSRADRVCVALHVGIALVVMIGLPVAAAVSTKLVSRVDGTPWYDLPFAIVTATLMAATLLLGLLAHRRWPGGLIAGTASAMLMLNVVFVAGYAHSREGRAELRPLADAIRTLDPPPRLVHALPVPLRPPEELAIHLDAILERVEDPASLQPVDRPTVLVVHQRMGELLPVPPTPQWRHFAHAPRDKNRWWAFLLPARDPATRPASDPSPPPAD
jgi:4-amino-4-deoxy-L-arabinose transferase-like glycosyltransferase